MQDQKEQKKQQVSRAFGPRYPDKSKTDKELVTLAHGFHQDDRKDDRKTRYDAVKLRHESIQIGTRWAVGAVVTVALIIAFVVLASDFMLSHRPGPQSITIKTEQPEEKK